MTLIEGVSKLQGQIAAINARLAGAGSCYRVTQIRFNTRNADFEIVVGNSLASITRSITTEAEWDAFCAEEIKS